MDLVLNPDQDLVSDESGVSDNGSSPNSQRVLTDKKAVNDSGFAPAYYDSATETVYLSRYSDGSVAPIHVLDGIPRDLFLSGEGRFSELHNKVVHYC